MLETKISSEHLTKDQKIDFFKRFLLSKNTTSTCTLKDRVQYFRVSLNNRYYVEILSFTIDENGWLKNKYQIKMNNSQCHDLSEQEGEQLSNMFFTQIREIDYEVIENLLNS